MYRARGLKDPFPVPFSTPTPKERAAEAEKKRDASPWDTPRVPLFPLQIIANDRSTVQVEFYTHITKIQRRTLPDMQGSVTLEPDGSLDTGKLMLLWGLENCVPVNPETLIPMHTYELRRTDIIPKQAVMKLIGKRRSIAFLEWEDVTQSTASKREVREMYWTFTTSLSILYNVFAGFLHDISPPLSSMFPSFASLTQVLGELYGRLANVAQLMLTRVYTTSLLHVERYHRLLRCLYLETGIAEAVREIAQITNSEGTLTVIALVGVILFGFWASGYGF